MPKQITCKTACTPYLKNLTYEYTISYQPLHFIKEGKITEQVILGNQMEKCSYCKGNITSTKYGTVNTDGYCPKDSFKLEIKYTAEPINSPSVLITRAAISRNFRQKKRYIIVNSNKEKEITGIFVMESKSYERIGNSRKIRPTDNNYHWKSPRYVRKFCMFKSNVKKKLNFDEKIDL
jgi:hypothetical protein